MGYLTKVWMIIDSPLSINNKLTLEAEGCIISDRDNARWFGQTVHATVITQTARQETVLKLLGIANPDDFTFEPNC